MATNQLSGSGAARYLTTNPKPTLGFDLGAISVLISVFGARRHLGHARTTIKPYVFFYFTLVSFQTLTSTPKRLARNLPPAAGAQLVPPRYWRMMLTALQRARRALVKRSSGP